MIPWEAAWTQALYGPSGFYRRSEGPAGHFRTAAHAAPGVLAAALAALARDAGCAAIVDVGAGRGELLGALRSVGWPRLHGVDVVARPAGLPSDVGWSGGLDAVPPGVLDPPGEGVLVVAWELLDVVPCPVLEVDVDGDVREVLVDPSGIECLGGPASAADRAWWERWWPMDGAEPGTRVEVGAPRDALWARLVQSVPRGLLLAVDYAHRRAARPPLGSLSAFRAGRAVPPVPDGSCDLTAHVAIDAVAAAGERAGASRTSLTAQREALLALGVGGPAELLDPGGLGGFAWLTQVRGPAAQA